jgi:hypothetical protein
VGYYIFRELIIIMAFFPSRTAADDTQQGQQLLFSRPQRPARLWDPPRLLWNEYLGPFPRWKSGRADRSPPPHVEVKNDGAMPPLPHTPPWRGA